MLGADGIKGERIKTEDIYRDMTFFNKWIAGMRFHLGMAGTEIGASIAVDMKSEQERIYLQNWWRSKIVLLRTFVQGDEKTEAYGYDDMKKINPSIIYCSASGWEIPRTLF